MSNRIVVPQSERIIGLRREARELREGLGVELGWLREEFEASFAQDAAASPHSQRSESVSSEDVVALVDEQNASLLQAYERGAAFSQRRSNLQLRWRQGRNEIARAMLGEEVDAVLLGFAYLSGLSPETDASEGAERAMLQRWSLLRPDTPGVASDFIYGAGYFVCGGRIRDVLPKRPTPAGDLSVDVFLRERNRPVMHQVNRSVQNLCLPQDEQRLQAGLFLGEQEIDVFSILTASISTIARQLPDLRVAVGME